jgi:integrase
MSTWIDKQGRRHVGVMVRGQRVHRILAEGATAGDAKRIEAEIRSSLASGRQVMIPGDPPMTEALALYVEHAARSLRSPDTAIHHARRVGPWAAKYRASQARECAAHMVRDMTGHYAAGTINRSLGALKKALSLAWESGRTPENYGLRIRRMAENNQREAVLTVEQVQLLTEHASPAVATAIWIALYTGCRRGEIIGLRPEDVDGDTIRIRAGNTKSLRTRTVPVVAPLRPYLAALPLPINAEGLKTGFRRAREAAGLSEFTFHDLRRSCATIMIQAGVDLYVVSKLLGHSTVAVTQARYAHMQVDRIRDGLKAAFG